MLRQSANAKRKLNTEAKSSRTSRSSTALPSNSGNTSKIPCSVSKTSNSKSQSGNRLRKKEKQNKIEDDDIYCAQGSILANIDTLHQEKLEEVILRCGQHEKDILSSVEDIFYRRISTPADKSHQSNRLNNINISLKTELSTNTNQDNIRNYNPIKGKRKSLPEKGDILIETNKNTVSKTIKKSTRTKSVTPKKEEISEEKDDVKNIEDKKSKKYRPTTAPTKEKAVSEVKILRKSISGIRPLEKMFVSKIPIPLKHSRENNNKWSLKKSETSPELHTDDDNSERLKINRKGSKTNIRVNSKIPARLRSTSVKCKKHRFGRRRNPFKQENSSRNVEKNALVKSPVDFFPMINVESSIPDFLDTDNNMIFETVPQDILNNESNLKEDNVVHKLKIDNRKFASRIPIGTKTNEVVLNVTNVSNSGRDNDIGSIGADKMSKLSKNILIRRMINYQVMAIPTIIYPEVPKNLNITSKTAVSKENRRVMKKLEDIDKGKRLDRKESLENIPKRRMHLSSGDKSRSSSKIFFTNKLSSKMKLNKVANKIVKFKRYSNFKHCESKNKFNFKSNASSPNFRQISPEKQKKRVQPKEIEKNTINRQNKVFQIRNSEIKENVGLNGKIKSFSDTDLLKTQAMDIKNTFREKKKWEDLLHGEKSIQTGVNTNDMEIQIDISNGIERNIEGQAKLYNDFKAINDYCNAILEAKMNVEEVLKRCSSTTSLKSVDIGCQAELRLSIDSSSQTYYNTTNRSSQCHNKMQPKALTKFSKINYCKSYRNTPTRPKLNVKLTKSCCSVRQSIISEKRIPGKVLLYLTVDACAAGLDQEISKRKMSCYCKEAPPDKKAKIQEDRPKNLFEDDDDEADYSESYMQALVNSVQLDDDSKICGSTPSLPDVAVGTDRCESKLEIPWLKISLAPPGYYQIKKHEGRPKQVMCDCWNLSASDDIYTEPVVEEICEPECKCTSKTTEEVPKKSDVKFEEKASTEDNSVEKEPSLQKPSSNDKRKSATEKESVAAAQKDPSEIAKKEEPRKSTTSADPKSSEAMKREESKKSTASAEKKPSEAAKLEEVESKKSKLEEAKPEEEANPEEAESEDAKPEETKSGAITPKESTAKPMSRASSNRAGTAEQEEELREVNLEEEQSSLKDESKISDRPSGNTDCLSSSSSSSLPSDCICLTAKDECEDILGRPTAFVFDNPCFAQHEGYLDPIYKLFPDDCDTYCGPHIEMPWSELTIPRKIKLRQAKRPVENKTQSKCACKPEEVVVCGKKEDAAASNNQLAVPISNPQDNQIEKMDKSFEIQLSFTEIISNMAALENKCAPSGVSVSIRPSSKERSSCSDAHTSSYSCKCGSPRSKQNSPTGKSRTSKGKNNTTCRCPSRDVSFAKIESTGSHASRCRNSPCKQPSPNGKPSRKPSDQVKPTRKDSYQDPVMNVLETCEAEMEPLRDTLNQLKSKIRNLNIPELNSWNNNTMQCRPCSVSGPITSPLMQPSSPTNRSPTMSSPHCMPVHPCMPQPPCMPQHPCMPPPSCMPPPPNMPTPSQNFPSMQRPPQFPFPPMFPPMPAPPPPARLMPPPRRCCPQCACKELRPRRRSPRSASSSTEYSEYDSLSDEESGCPFLRALSSKNIYKDRDSRTQRKCRGREEKKKPDRQVKKCSNCSGKKYNKRSQADYSRQDICTDTEPEIQVHYGPKHPKMKTKHVFKGVIDKPNIGMTKNQRLRIAVKVSPSGQEVFDENYLAIQGPCEYK